MGATGEGRRRTSKTSRRSTSPRPGSSSNPRPSRLRRGATSGSASTPRHGTHGFAIKAFRVKALIPKMGEAATVEFVADQAGTFDITCSEHCGFGHAGMQGRLVVLAKKEMRCPSILLHRPDQGARLFAPSRTEWRKRPRRSAALESSEHERSAKVDSRGAGRSRRPCHPGLPNGGSATRHRHEPFGHRP